MSRWLLPGLALAQVLGILLADRTGLSHEASVVAGLAVFALAAFARAPGVRLGLLLVALALAGAAASSRRLEASLPTPGLAREATFEATLGAGPGRDAIPLHDVRSVDGAGPLPRHLILRLDREHGGAQASPITHGLPGERWRLRGRVRPVRSLRNPGRPDRSHVLRRRGIAATARLVHPALAVRVGSDGRGPLHAMRGWRRARAERLAAAGPGGSLLAALSLGARDGLDPEVRDAFARLGLAHLLAVSGLHLSLVAAFVFVGVRRAVSRSAGFAARFDARNPALGAALLAAAAYAVLTGPAIPVQRAFVLLAAAVVALAARRPRRSAHPLALASLILLGREPAALFEPGFQLSFAATAALLAAASPPAGPDDATVRRSGTAWLAGLLRISAAALLATAPLSAFHFGRIAPIGLLANLIAIPATALVLLPASFLALLSAAGEGAFAAGVLRVAESLAAAALLTVQRAADAAPGSLPTAPPSAVGLALAAGIAVTALRSVRIDLRMAAVVAQAAVLAVLPPAAITPLPPRVVVFDVGQGDATLVQGRGASLLVDAGPALPGGFDAGRDAVVPALRALGVARLERVAVTHADLDHRGGVPAVLRALPVGAVWLPRGGAADPAFAPVREAARAEGVAVLEKGAGDPDESLADLAVSFLAPAPGGDPGRNDGSLILRVATAAPHATSVLLPGDAERGAERSLLARGPVRTADVLKLAHHGSRTSSSRAFLAATAPRLAVASAPCAGRFGMPHPSVVARLAALGIPLAWTGRDGAVIVGLSPQLPLRTWGTPRRGCTSVGPHRHSRLGLAVFPRENR